MLPSCSKTVSTAAIGLFLLGFSRFFFGLGVGRGVRHLYSGRNLVGLIDARIDQLGGEAEAPAEPEAAPAAEAEPVEDEEAETEADAAATADPEPESPATEENE